MQRQGISFGPGIRPSRPTVKLPEEYWRQRNLDLEARIGQPNDWTIPIPDELAQAVRKAIKAEKASAAKSAEKSDAVKSSG